MTIEPIKHHQIRYYRVSPTDKTIEQCESHGRDHKAYGWAQQIDPRWSDEQITAYRNAYAGHN